MYTNAFTEFWWRTQIEVQRNTGDSRRLARQRCNAASCWTTGIASARPISRVSRCRCFPLAIGVPCTCTCAATSRGGSAPRPSTSGSSSIRGRTSTRTTPTGAKELQLRFLDRFLEGRRRRDGRRAAGEARDSHEAVRSSGGTSRSGRSRTHSGASSTSPKERLPGSRRRQGSVGVSGDVRADGGRGDRADGAGGAAAVGVGAAGGLRRLRSAGAIRRKRGAVEPIGPQGAITPVPSAMGWLRASHRKLDPDADASVSAVPHARRAAATCAVDEPTLLEVEIWPTSITLAPGETLRLELLRRRHRPAGPDGAARTVTTTAPRATSPCSSVVSTPPTSSCR